ncbi:MAG: hypothetical protein KJ645_08755 [Planctomycetes bacterium]|nr:hypothetical protein [Planctomycetota bacterium]
MSGCARKGSQLFAGMVLFFAALFFIRGFAQVDSADFDKADPEARAFLDDLYRDYDLPSRNGLTELFATLRIQDATDPELAALRESLRIDYMWEFPFSDNVVVKSDNPELQATLESLLKGVWQDFCSGGVFGDLERKTLRLERSAQESLIHMRYKEHPRGVIRIRNDNCLAVSAEIVRKDRSALWEPTYEKHRGLYCLKSKKITETSGEEDGESTVTAYLYNRFTKIGKFRLPAELVVESGDDRLVFQIEFANINRRPVAESEEVDRLVADFMAQYPRIPDIKKINFIHRLEETCHDAAAWALAKRALKDKDPHLRMETIRALGEMRCKLVIPDLIEALTSCGNDSRLYPEVLLALGKMGDPALVTVLSLGFWEQWREAGDRSVAEIRLNGLGQIRSNRAVKALIDLLAGAKEPEWNDLGPVFARNLRHLTDQTFGSDREAWIAWWKAEGEALKLEDDQ